MDLIGFDTLFRRQQLIELRRCFGVNRYEFSQETTLFSREPFNIGIAVAYLGRGGKFLTVLFQLLSDRLRSLLGVFENRSSLLFLGIR
jgi:hypothetical protein